MKYCPHCDMPFPSEASACPDCGLAPVIRNGLHHYSPEMATSGSGFRPEYFDELAGLEAANFWFRARNDLIIDAIKKHFPLRRNFLEIGCGTGFVLSGIGRAFPGIALSGSELFTQGLYHASRRLPQAQLMQMDARRIPYHEEFDIIGAFDVIEHIEEDTTVLNAIHRALVPGGAAIFTVPQHPWLWSYSDEYACHVRRYKRGELEEKLQAAGMDVVFSTSFVSLLLPLLAVSRLRNKNSIDQDATSELKLPPTANSALYSIMQFERELIRRGVRFPFGGTRLVCSVKCS